MLAPSAADCVLAALDQAALDRELLEPLLGALEPLAQRRGAHLEVAVAAEDARDVLPRHVAVEAEQQDLVLLGIELLAQQAELVLDLGALDLAGDGADDGGHLRGDRQRQVGDVAAARVAAELGERVARQRVQPRPQRRLPAELRQALPDVLAELGERLGREVVVAGERAQEAEQLDAVAAQRGGGRRGVVAGLAQRADRALAGLAVDRVRHAISVRNYVAARSRSSCCSCSTRHRILPVADLGSASANSKRAGTL